MITSTGLVRIPGSEFDAWVSANDRTGALEQRVNVVVFDASDGVDSLPAAAGRPRLAALVRLAEDPRTARVMP